MGNGAKEQRGGEHCSATGKSTLAHVSGGSEEGSQDPRMLQYAWPSHSKRFYFLSSKCKPDHGPNSRFPPVIPFVYSFIQIWFPLSSVARYSSGFSKYVCRGFITTSELLGCLGSSAEMELGRKRSVGVIAVKFKSGAGSRMGKGSHQAVDLTKCLSPQ